MVVVYTHEFCHLALAPSNYAVLYKSSQFVHIGKYLWMYVCKHVCILRNCSKTTGRSATEVRMLSKHYSGKGSEVCWISRLTWSAPFRNTVRTIRSFFQDSDPKRRNEFDKSQLKRERKQQVSTTLSIYAYSRLIRRNRTLVFEKGFQEAFRDRESVSLTAKFFLFSMLSWHQFRTI